MAKDFAWASMGTVFEEFLQKLHSAMHSEKPMEDLFKVWRRTIRRGSENNVVHPSRIHYASADGALTAYANVQQVNGCGGI